MLMELSLLADLVGAFSGAMPEQHMLFIGRKPSNGLQIASTSKSSHFHRYNMHLRPKQNLPTIGWSPEGGSLLRWRGLLWGRL